MNRPLFRMAVMLGLISAIGPFAIDMYLPALPAIGASLHADPHAVQLSLMSFFLSFGISQIVYGPASDIFGRKPPLYFGIGLFVVGSIGCALAPDIGWLIAFRLVQGLGGGAPMVVPRAIVRDLHTGADATRLIAMLMLVLSVSPVLAPLIGSLVIESAGWRAIFWIVALLGLGGLVMLGVWLPETRSPEKRAASSVGTTLKAFGLLIRDRRFVGLTAIGTFGLAAFFIYLANSSFVLIEHHGLTPRQYSLAFGVNAIAFFGGSQLAGRPARGAAWLATHHFGRGARLRRGDVQPVGRQSGRHRQPGRDDRDAAGGFRLSRRDPADHGGAGTRCSRRDRRCCLGIDGHGAVDNGCGRDRPDERLGRRHRAPHAGRHRFGVVDHVRAVAMDIGAHVACPVDEARHGGWR